MEKLRIGVLGMSEGNGHPYSWGAIFNGFDQEYMNDCPFPVISEYLGQQSFPKDAIPNAFVTHIWTQEKEISKHIASAAKIPNIVENYEDMIGHVDAVLLARDDPENHYEMSKPFLEAGLPIFIDKPLATSINEAEKIFALQKYEGQIFTCSSLRYAKEFQRTEEISPIIDNLRLVDATIPKSWTKYAIHIVEPVLNLLPNLGKPIEITNSGKSDINIVTVHWSSNVTTVFKVLGKTSCPLSIRLFGENSFKELVFKDTYYAFKTSLEHFIKGIRENTIIIPRKETMSVLEVIEKGFQKV